MKFIKQRTRVSVKTRILNDHTQNGTTARKVSLWHTIRSFASNSNMTLLSSIWVPFFSQYLLDSLTPCMPLQVLDSYVRIQMTISGHEDELLSSTSCGPCSRRSGHSQCKRVVLFTTGIYYRDQLLDGHFSHSKIEFWREANDTAIAADEYGNEKIMVFHIA